ncbi:MAG: DNA helicase RecQ [Oscillospiraceae bacterium]|nr:DNA helicase RecQ [Oscillospiraceae bacterium]
MDKHTALHTCFGLSSFRSGQEALIDAVLQGRDVLGIMPTGGGKSLCYQVPAVMLDGVALIISPLISLMKDQVMALKNIGVSAAFINSSLSPEQLRMAYGHMRAGQYKIVYIAPERLAGDGFVSLAQSLNISLVAVDEAHCISQWGQDFRPSYLKIVDFLEKLPRRPALAAFTATATQQVRDDIARILKLREPLRLITGFDRPNLNFEVHRPKRKINALHALTDQRRDKSGIVYCATRKLVESVCDELSAAGLSATRYHAGLPDEERRQNQEDFLYDRRPVMVATNAFGMGIDKSNVSYVIHYNMPKSLEAYYQEAGRAGRDGERADCILLYSSGDIAAAKFLIQHSSDNDELSGEERRIVTEQDYLRLDSMVGYCKTASCLRGYILDYFGQAHGERCGNCSHCCGEYAERDITSEAQMILSCVKRAKDRLGYPVGATLIVRVLCGGKDKRVLELGLDQLTTYGLMSTVPRPQIRDYIEHLESAGYLRTDPVHGGVELTPMSGEVLFRGGQVLMSVKQSPVAEKAHTAKTEAPVGDGDPGLFTALKALRFKLAQEEGVPAYIVFSNANLADMARKEPKTMAEFKTVSGVGEIKAARYGEAFLQAIAAFERDGARG